MFFQFQRCMNKKNLAYLSKSKGRCNRGKQKTEQKEMPTLATLRLFALRKSLLCKPHPSDSIDAQVSGRVNANQTRPKPQRSGSVGCLSNLKDVFHGSKIHKGTGPSSGHSKVVGSRSVYSKPNINNEIVLNNLGTLVKTNGLGATLAKESSDREVNGHHEHHNMVPYYGLQRSISEHLRNFYGYSAQRRSLSDQHSKKSCEGPPLVCQLCGVQHIHSKAVESSRLSKHAVSELVEGASPRKVVEIICQSGASSKIDENTKIERILKVHNTQNILDQFEDYREIVKTKESRQSKTVDLRCLADGNELLRFCATTISCSLGMNGSSNPCKLNACGACRILRNGFSARKDFVGRFGIFAASTGERALKYVDEEGHHFKRKALFVCRAIAGKIHSPVGKFDQGFSSSGFDSLAWKLGRNRSPEELFLLNSRALLPCFVVIYKDI